MNERRIIKFRAWDKWLGAWVDNTTPYADEVYVAPDGTIWNFSSGEGGVHFSRAEENRYEIVWSTGLKDKNGVEIYEGDIANSDFGIGTIEYGEISKAPEFHFDTGSDDLWLWCCKNSTFEVIGNIHELLKKK